MQVSLDTPESFPQFNLFPLEIRCLIWKSCLPRRITEEDFPFTLLDGKESRQACWPVRTTLQNARVPLLATVCAEARAVVFEWGGHQISQDETSLDSIWVQPKIDRALHLNWTRRRDDEYYRVNDFNRSAVVVEEFICRAKDVYVIRLSLVGEFFCSFDLGNVVKPLSSASFDTDSMVVDSMVPEIPSMPVDKYEDAREYDLREAIDLLLEQENKIIYATVVAISIHVDRAAALASGLFGLQADAPVQTVDYDDAPQLRQFYELFNSDPALGEAEPHVERLFDAILSPAFHEAVLSWQKKVRWLLQVGVWRGFQTGDYLKTFEGLDPRSMWTPPVPQEQMYMRMDHFVPNENHSWWEEHAEKYMPKVVPQVMLRLCDNRCYEKERRPETFGEVWHYNAMVQGSEKTRGVGQVIPWAGDLAPRNKLCCVTNEEWERMIFNR
ncbi:hypothetical protein DL95DRAFT_518000 [Leptodontidium sp. 2 PMI_412]|nr:hypothetical protein DL95DRAFT_518000 [Leptodontidium sp. 2 PMI_412]